MRKPQVLCAAGPRIHPRTIHEFFSALQGASLQLQNVRSASKKFGVGQVIISVPLPNDPYVVKLVNHNNSCHQRIFIVKEGDLLLQDSEFPNEPWCCLYRKLFAYFPSGGCFFQHLSFLFASFSNIFFPLSNLFLFSVVPTLKSWSSHTTTSCHTSLSAFISSATSHLFLSHPLTLHLCVTAFISL